MIEIRIKKGRRVTCFNPSQDKLCVFSIRVSWQVE